MKIPCSILVFLVVCFSAIGQELVRRSFLGIQAAKKDGHVTVTNVALESTASAAGVLPQDELLTINGEPISDASQIPDMQRRFRAGSPVQFSLRRAGAVLTKSATALPISPETNPDFTTIYKTVDAGGTLYRAIITKPKREGRHPAVFLIGGLGCYSLDPLKENGAYAHVLFSLTRDGFITMRVDKSGEGDSEGPPCTSDAATFDLAVQRSVAGLKALAGYDFVDPSHVFVFAHSLGPLEGAVAVARAPVRGFIAAETIGTSWFDYQVQIARSQPLLSGDSYQDTEAFTRRNLGCLSLFYVQGLSEAEVVKAQPDCQDDLPSQAGMPAEYFRGIGKLDLAATWQHIDVPVLVAYGTSDPLTSREQSQYLVNMINSAHPGRAAYVEFEHMSHRLDQQPDQVQALKALTSGTLGPFDRDFVPRIEQWMRSI